MGDVTSRSDGGRGGLKCGYSTRSGLGLSRGHGATPFPLHPSSVTCEEKREELMEKTAPTLYRRVKDLFLRLRI